MSGQNLAERVIGAWRYQHSQSPPRDGANVQPIDSPLTPTVPAPVLPSETPGPVAPAFTPRLLFCLACGSEEICARSLCPSCYDAAYHDDSYFAGAKANVLARDGHGCRVCGEATNVVHHRRPGCDQEKWLITLCPACHATVERLERLDRYLPPLLLALWREQHPDAGEQLALELAASWEATTGDPSKQPDRKSSRDERRDSTTRSRCQFS